MQESTHTLVSSLYMAQSSIWLHMHMNICMCIVHVYAYCHVHVKCIGIWVMSMHTQVEIHMCRNMHMHIYKCPFQPPLLIYCADFHALGFHNPMKILLFHVALNAMQCLSSKYVQVYTLFSIFSQECDIKCEYAFCRRHSSHVNYEQAVHSTRRWIQAVLPSERFELGPDCPSRPPLGPRAPSSPPLGLPALSSSLGLFATACCSWREVLNLGRISWLSS